MDRISGLPDELLLRILSVLPTTKAAVATSILAKRWRFLWMLLSTLEYSDRYYSSSESQTLRRFLNRNLPLHRAPVIERFSLNFVRGQIKPEDMKQWVLTAVYRYVQELDITFNSEEEDVIPKNLYICKSLVVLSLSGVTITDIPSMAHLPALKTLKIRRSYFTEESFHRLLSICPILEDLRVKLRTNCNNITNLRIIVPTLKRLSLCLIHDWELDGYLIDTPSVTYFKLHECGFLREYSVFKNMPRLTEAVVDVEEFGVHKCVIESIASVKILTIRPQSWYGSFVYNHLQHLKLCLREPVALDYIGEYLQHSPILRVLDISASIIELDSPVYEDGWDRPITVPECLSSTLQILNWSGYFGRPEEIDIVVYILQNACHLKKATIKVDATCDLPVVKNKLAKAMVFAYQSRCRLILIGDGEEHVI